MSSDIISNFFPKRKRPVHDDAGISAKLRALDGDNSTRSVNPECSKGLKTRNNDKEIVNVRIVCPVKSGNHRSPVNSLFKEKNKIEKNAPNKRKCKNTKETLPDIRKCFLTQLKRISEQGSLQSNEHEKVTKEHDEHSESAASVHAKGIPNDLTDCKTAGENTLLQKIEDVPANEDAIATTQNILVNDNAPATSVINKQTKDETASNCVSANNIDCITQGKLAIKDLSLDEIKRRLQQSKSRDTLKKNLLHLKKTISNIEKKQEQRSLLSFEHRMLEQKRKQYEALAQHDDSNSDSETTKEACCTPNSPQLSKFDLLEIPVTGSPVTTPTKAKRQVLMSPVKSNSPVKISPAYKRYAPMAVPPIPTLNLPTEYVDIFETFCALEGVVSLMFNRKEVITFKNIKLKVQEISRRNFTLNQVGQIRTVHSGAYKFSQRRIRPGEYDLQFEPVLSGEHMSSHIMCERKKIFRTKLLEIVKHHHEKFLASLNPPLKVDSCLLMRWHPEFELHTVPSVPPAPLPEPPNVQHTSAQSVLELAKEKFDCNERVVKALSNRQEDDAALQLPASVNQVKQEFEKLLNGIPKSILEKVRAKQATKAMKIMTKSKEQEKEERMYRRLPDVARVLRSIFVLEKKNVLPGDKVFSTLQNSILDQLTLVELKEHVQLLAEMVPGWILSYPGSSFAYIKLVKTSDINKITNAIQKSINEKFD